MLEILILTLIYRDYLREIQTLPESLPFVGRFSLNADEAVIAQDIAKTIGFETTKRITASKTGYFSYISELLENVGILIMKNGIVGSNTHRKLNVLEFKGIVFADKQVPVIFVNGADATAAQLFTLMHEVAHIWLGESGVSNPNQNSRNRTEQLCNRVAAEFLVPGQEFHKQWRSQTDENNNLDTLAKYFHVSTYVIAIKALQNKLISQKKFQEICQNFAIQNKGSGSNSFNTIPVRNSKRLTKALIHSAMSKKILLRDAAKLLSVKPNTVVELYKRDTSRIDVSNT